MQNLAKESFSTHMNLCTLCHFATTFHPNYVFIWIFIGHTNMAETRHTLLSFFLILMLRTWIQDQRMMSGEVVFESQVLLY